MYYTAYQPFIDTKLVNNPMYSLLNENSYVCGSIKWKHYVLAYDVEIDINHKDLYHLVENVQAVFWKIHYGLFKNVGSLLKSGDMSVSYGISRTALRHDKTR